MLTVLPVAENGVSYGIWVLESLIKRYEDKVAAIIQIGGEVDEKHPTSAATFIVVMMDGFTFTAFVSDRGSMPEREDYSGTGSSYYERFRKFVFDFQGAVTGIPGLFSDNSREVNQYGLKAKCMGFSWDNFFSAISEDLGFKEGTNAEVREKFYALTTTQKMEAYRIFLVSEFFTHLWEVIPPSTKP